MNLTDTINHLLAESGRRTRLDAGTYKGLGLGYRQLENGRHQLTISRVGLMPARKEQELVLSAICQVANVYSDNVERKGPLYLGKHKQHVCIRFEWEKVSVADFFSLSPEEQAQILNQVKKK